MKDVINYPNYMLTEDGKIWSKNRNRFLIGGLDEYGYHQWVACNEEGRRTLKVHREVAKLYCSNPNNYNIVNHVDGVKLHNNFENLEWCTISHNTKEAYRLGFLTQVGEHNNSCKYNDDVVKMVIDNYQGQSIAEYARQLGMNYAVVYSYIRKLRRV
jgi:hypothetical protein